MLVIFDCDGVLVETESISNRLMAGILTQRGLPITMEESRRRFLGLSLSSVRDVVLRDNGIDIGEDFADVVYSRLPEIFARGVESIPHVGHVISILRDASVPYCVASSGKISKMHMTLGSAGLLDDLKDVLFSAWDVERGKPFPDLFEYAAKTMGYACHDCVVIEDSVPGVQAGVAAGMRVLAYTADPLSDGDGLAAAGGELFRDMREVPALLGLT